MVASLCFSVVTLKRGYNRYINHKSVMNGQLNGLLDIRIRRLQKFTENKKTSFEISLHSFINTFFENLLTTFES